VGGDRLSLSNRSRGDGPVRGLDAVLPAIVRFCGNRIHTLAGDRIDVGRFAQDHREHMMAGGRLGEMDVGFEANSLEVADLFGRHDVIEIFGNRIRVEAHAGADHLRSTQAEATHGVAGAVDEVFGELAGFDLLGELLLIDWVKDIIQIGQERAER
jgi:hypothetical protein